MYSTNTMILPSSSCHSFYPLISMKGPLTTMTVGEEERRCRYPSKRCENARTLKKNGDLHSMCEFHRAKANRNQRRLEQKRKTIKRPRSTTVANDSFQGLLLQEPSWKFSTATVAATLEKNVESAAQFALQEPLDLIDLDSVFLGSSVYGDLMTSWNLDMEKIAV